MAFDPYGVQMQNKNLLESNTGDVCIITNDGDEIMAHSCILTLNPAFLSIIRHIKRIRLNYSTIAIKEFLAYIYYRKQIIIDGTKIKIFLELLELAHAYEYKAYSNYLLSEITKSMQKCQNIEHIIEMLQYSNERQLCKIILTSDIKVIQQTCEETLNKIIKRNESMAIKTLYRLQYKGNNKTFFICKAIIDTICEIPENNNNGNDGKDKKSNNIIDDNTIDCCICAETIKTPIALQCGHTRFCEDCIKKIKICPLCNQPYTNIIKLFK